MGVLNEKNAQIVLARHFNCYAQLVVPNVFFGGGEMDMAIVTKAGYLVEVEIKLTLADWNCDRAKTKWTKPEERAKVSRFYYAVPTGLLALRPAWVPRVCGLLEILWSEKSDWGRCEERVKARRSEEAKPITDTDRVTLLNSTYHRFWRRELKEAA